MENQTQEDVVLKSGIMLAGCGDIPWAEIKDNGQLNAETDIVFAPEGSGDMVLLAGNQFKGL